MRLEDLFSSEATHVIPTSEHCPGATVGNSKGWSTTQAASEQLYGKGYKTPATIGRGEEETQDYPALTVSDIKRKGKHCQSSKLPLLHLWCFIS